MTLVYCPFKGDYVDPTPFKQAAHRCIPDCPHSTKPGCPLNRPTRPQCFGLAFSTSECFDCSYYKACVEETMRQVKEAHR